MYGETVSRRRVSRCRRYCILGILTYRIIDGSGQHFALMEYSDSFGEGELDNRYETQGTCAAPAALCGGGTTTDGS